MSDIADATVTAEGQTEGKVAGKVKVTQIGSPIGRKPYQKKNLIGLGLNKMHRSRVLENTPEVQGMIARVSHLLKVETVDGGEG